MYILISPWVLICTECFMWHVQMVYYLLHLWVPWTSRNQYQTHASSRNTKKGIGNLAISIRFWSWLSSSLYCSWQHFSWTLWLCLSLFDQTSFQASCFISKLPTLAYPTCIWGECWCIGSGASTHAQFCCHLNKIWVGHRVLINMSSRRDTAVSQVFYSHYQKLKFMCKAIHPISELCTQ